MLKYSTKTKKIVADEEVAVAPEAADLLFEAEDVAELIAEVTDKVVEVTADGDEVTFAVGDAEAGEDVEEYAVTAEGDEEVLEASNKSIRGKAPVAASRRPMARKPMASRPVSASRRPIPARRPVSASRRPMERTTAPVKASKSIKVMPKSKRTEQ